MRMFQTVVSAAIAAAALTLSASAFADPSRTVVDFSKGEAGWVNLPIKGDEGSWIQPGGGVGGSSGWQTRSFDTYGLTWSNHQNSAFIGDYTSSKSISFGIDIKADSITYLGGEVSRDVIVELRDYDNPVGGVDYNSVWVNLGSISAGKGWQHLGVTIEDTSSTALPTGWFANTGDGVSTGLPEGKTFSDFLKGVDAIAFTTHVWGNAYGNTNFDVTVDNISITPVPEPSTYAMLAAGLLLMARVARRRAQKL